MEELAGERPRRKPTWSGQDEHCTFSAGGSSRRRRGFVGQNMKEAVEELAGERPRPTILMRRVAISVGAQISSIRMLDM